MTDLVDMIDTNTAIGKIVAGGGMATLTFREWLAFNRDELGPVGGDLIVENEARAMGMTLAQLVAASDRATIYVKAVVWGPDAVEVKSYAYGGRLRRQPAGRPVADPAGGLPLPAAGVRDERAAGRGEPSDPDLLAALESGDQDVLGDE